MSKVRVRFAPSPTGPLHIGGARSALFNYLLAARSGGDFILRVEDTDVQRSSAASEQNIKDSLGWLGIDWSEGVDKGGPYGPYRQTERLPLYRQAVEKLLSSGQAYPCFCTEEQLAARRGAQVEAGITPHYDGPCQSLSPAEQAHFQEQGRPYAIRFRVPPGQELVIEDMVRGRVVFSSDEIGGDFIIMKSDGLPTYNFGVVVDDAQMQISHVVRGEEHLSNTPRQLLLYRALGYQPPYFAHVSLILGPDGSKMSKRHGSVSVENYRAQGYLPQALLNFLALLGWSPEGEQEQLSLGEICQKFSLERVSKSPAVFDAAKLRWLNGQYLRALPLGDIAAGIAPYLPEAFDERQALLLAEAVGNQLETFGDVEKFLPLLEPGQIPPLDEEAREILAQPHVGELLTSFARRIQDIPPAEFTAPAVKAAIKGAGKDTGAKGAALFMVLRVAITGLQHGPDLDKIAALLGQEQLLKRIAAHQGEK